MKGKTKMKNFDIGIENRIIEEALYTIENNSTVRNTALQFGVAKSTVHKDITERLYDISISLYEEVSKVLGFNKIERARRGGLAIKHKRKTITEV